MRSQTYNDFNYQSHFVSVKGTSFHYLDEKRCKECDTVFLFLHGNPTSSYLWRNIIPFLTSEGRCIAPDLIGFGKSGKPDIDYTFSEHYQYIEAFIEKLNLEKIILVLHDWGGAIGFHFARQYPDKIQGIAFMETFYKPMEWDSLDPFAKWLFRRFQDQRMGKFLNGHLNLFIKFILPFSMNRKLSKSEKEVYFKPFHSLKSRKPIIKFPQELPFRGSQTKNELDVQAYYEWLQRTNIPKLLLYAEPGVQIKERDLPEIKRSLPNITTRYIGKGKHFIQEDQPKNIGIEIKEWFRNAIKY